MSNRLRILLLLLIVLLGFGGYAVFISTPAGPRNVRAFDPDRTAVLETEMWKAYYDKRTVALFNGLMQVTREMYRCPRSTAFRIAFHFARAASAFGNLRRDYEQVLPDLEDGYRIAKSWSGLSYDPATIARAELAWWVARRVPGKDSPEQVGGLIADLNAQFYGVPRENVLEASILRARAGKLRDVGGPSADWTEVGRLLTESYRSLKKGVN
jgi:hypothetical protein